jgi:hypothetical protein
MLDGRVALPERWVELDANRKLRFLSATFTSTN